MANIPFDFWRDLESGLYGAAGRVILEIFLAGVKSGTIALPERLVVLQDWNVINRAAQEYLKNFRLDTVRGITDSLRDAIISAIDTWIETGAPFDVLVKQLESPGLLGPARAQRIAVTEVTRAYASGNKSSWIATGLVSGMTWATAEDEKVCPICGPLDGKTVSIDSGFMLDESELPEQIAQNLARTGHDLIFYQPPAHPNCRCWLKPFVSENLLRNQLDQVLGL